jgi:hypothetical protein
MDVGDEQLCGDAFVAVVQATDFRRRHDGAGRGRLHDSRYRQSFASARCVRERV